ncbi:AAA family ATPase [Ancylobacter sp. 6x-1]|uniref:AAA family ATPase n=1 Tax=Ancylobacter crimeensis TaxID=2579147 RepID=A0ABT0DEV0_9HYPH|nr:AAA family ATPase [Ancylobacter crimeensis]MCK0198493.1 AAA family ATPase [Ancylobacter crimeensis]
MDRTDTDRFIIVTGGPGSGKSTLLAALAGEGFATMPEAGRGIIRAQSAIDGPALPWRDPLAFAGQMLGWELRSHAEAGEKPGIVLFDRGVPDVLGYLALCGIGAPAHMERAALRLRYRPRVFIAPPWPAIYANDTERRQDFAEAVATHDALAATYARLGYELVALPLASVAERVRFVRADLAQAGRA